MKKKIKIYRMPISRVFPAKHPRAGEETNFEQSIINGFGCKRCSGRNHTIRCMDLDCTDPSIVKKIHTIRSFNPESKTWGEKIKEVRSGKAVFVLYEWIGKPYSADGCKDLFVFGTWQVKEFIKDRYKSAIHIIDNDIDVQKALFIPELNCASIANVNQQHVTTAGYSTIARNDGLSLDDFKAWFEGCDLSKPFEIIHFTKFRY